MKNQCHSECQLNAIVNGRCELNAPVNENLIKFVLEFIQKRVKITGGGGSDRGKALSLWGNSDKGDSLRA